MTILAITLTINPTSPIPSTLINQTFTALTTLDPTTRIFYGPSLTNPHETKILLTTPSPTPPTTTTQTTILKSLTPLTPHLTSPPTLHPLPTSPRPSFPAPLLNPPRIIPIDILHLTFPHPLPPPTQHLISRATDLLTLDISEASKPGGTDDNPCLECLCHFTSETEAWIWCTWKSESRRGEWMRRGPPTGNLRVWLGEEFGGWKEEGVFDFWEPVRWLGGGGEVEGGGWGVVEWVARGEGWWGWVRGLVGMG